MNVEGTDRPGAEEPGYDESSWYEIRLRGRLDERWAAWFDGMTMRDGAVGTTVLIGHVPDQAALYGMLARLSDLGLPLVSVRQMRAG